jgi:hypothetical protein
LSARLLAGGALAEEESVTHGRTARGGSC